MSSRRLAHWAFCALMLPAIAAYAESDPGDLLTRMATAAHRLDYEGTFIYEHNGQVQTIRILHSAAGGVERERIVTLSGPSKEVIRDDKTVTCLLGEKLSVVDHAGPGRPATLSISPDIERVNRHYDLAMAGRDRVAELEAVRIAIRPKDHYRYGMNLWMEVGSGLLLQSELLDEKGQVIERLLFTSLKLYDRLPPNLLESQARPKGSYPAPVAADGAAADARQWEVARLPPGFTLEALRQHNMPASGKAVQHRVYSDGLASVSVFVEPHAEGGDAFVGSSGMGATNAFARLVDHHLVTVVGEVPAATVQVIGEGIRETGGTKRD